MGVTKEGKLYRARISKDGVRHNLGSFDTELKATRALNKFKRENRTDPIQELYDPGKEMFTISERNKMQRPTITERVKNAYRNFRANSGTKKS